MVADSIGTNDRCFQIYSSTVRDGTNKICQSQVGCFDDLSPSSRMIPPFGRKQFQHNPSLGSLALTNGAEELRRKGCVSLKEPKQKRIRSETGTSRGSLETPTI